MEGETEVIQNNVRPVIWAAVGGVLMVIVIGIVFYFALIQAPVTRQASQEVNMSVPVEVEEVGAFEISEGRRYDQPVNVSGGQLVEFKNSGTGTVLLTIYFQEPIEEEIGAAGSYIFKYPDGYAELEFGWSGGGVVLRKRV